MTVRIHIECEDEFTPREVKEAVADFIMDMMDYLNDQAIEFGRKKGYEQGHKDGMTEAVTRITE